MRSLILKAADRLNDRQTRWFIWWLTKWALLILAVILYTIILSRVSDAKAERRYEAWKTEFAASYEAQQEAAARALVESDPAVIRLNAEAELLAKVLYGIRDNSTDDLKTACWCVFNRVDNPQFPNTLAEVVGQPKQWMRYDADNPVLESLYDLAREQLELWHGGTRRPVSDAYVFMSWSQDDVVLRDTWETGSRSKYWRYGQ